MPGRKTVPARAPEAYEVALQTSQRPSGAAPLSPRGPVDPTSSPGGSRASVARRHPASGPEVAWAARR
eukprot:10293682-Lingulodinium_polyedra.AAC.1